MTVFRRKTRRSCRLFAGASALVAVLLSTGPTEAEEPPPAGPVAAIPGYDPAPGFVRVEGKRFVSPDGATFPIRGMSLGNWLVPEGYMFKFATMRSPRQIERVIERLVGPEAAARFWTRFRDAYITRDDIAFLKAAGFTTVRVPLHYRFFVEAEDPAHPDAVRFEGEGWGRLDALFGWCRELGMKVILDMHAAPGGQTGVNHDDGIGYPLTFYVPAYRRLTIAVWREIARRYRDEPALLGYDLLNEPISTYHDIDYLNDRLQPFYEEITAAIRSVDPNHVVIVEGAQWAVSFEAFGPPFADNVAYSYHKFWASPERRSVQAYVDFANRWNVPVFVGETGELNDEWNAAYRAVNERFGLGWSFWTYKNLDSQSTIASIRMPAGWDAIAKLGSVPVQDFDTAPVPDRAVAQSVLDAYLANLPLARTHINDGYILSLGGTVPPLPETGGAAPAEMASSPAVPGGAAP